MRKQKIARSIQRDEAQTPLRHAQPARCGEWHFSYVFRVQHMEPASTLANALGCLDLCLTRVRSGALLFRFFRFVGSREKRIFQPLAIYLTPDSQVGAIKTYVLLV